MEHVFLLSMPSSAGGGLVAIFFLILLLIPAIFYVLTLQNTLKAIQPQNRKMAPINVWLLFIPIFNFVWNFFVVTNITKSIDAEYASKGVNDKTMNTYNIGLAMSILYCINWIPLLSVLTAIPTLICWILFWVQISGHKNRIIALSQSTPATTQYHN